MRYLDHLLLIVIHRDDLQSLLLLEIVLYLFMLAHFIYEKVINHQDQLHVAREHLREYINVPSHGELLDCTLRLKYKALLSQLKGLLESETMVINQNP